MRWFWTLLLLSLSFILTACGQQNEQDVIQDLEQRNQEVESYQSRGKMVIQTGQEPLTYDIEVWYKHPSFYRVAVRNVKKDITQVLLRNREGVFVLTPHLKKSFRFQSDWPETNGQVYLYQTLLKSILHGKGRKFHASEAQYRFDVEASTARNAAMIKQRIWLDHDLHPQKVNILSPENRVIIDVTFQQFKEDPSFDTDAFDMKRNMQQMGAISEPSAGMRQPAVEVSAPAYLPTGHRLRSEQSVKAPDGQVTIMRYSGKHPFSITVAQAAATHELSANRGMPVQLDQAIGVLSTTDRLSKLMWVYEGNQYELLGKLPRNELMKIANSTFQQQTK